MKIIKVEETDGRPETKGCLNGASKILEQLKDNENIKQELNELRLQQDASYVGDIDKVEEEALKERKLFLAKLCGIKNPDLIDLKKAELSYPEEKTMKDLFKFHPVTGKEIE